MKYRLSICGTYPGAAPYEWRTEDAECETEAELEAIAADVADQFDAWYPEKAPHSVTAEADEASMEGRNDRRRSETKSERDSRIVA